MLPHMMCQTFCRLVLATVLCGPLAAAENEPATFNPQGQPNRSRPGPWDNDVLVYAVEKSGVVEKLATFPRAGVPRGGRQPGAPGGEVQRPFSLPIITARDANGDRKLTPEELRPAR